MAEYPTNSLIVGAVLLALCIAMVFIGLIMAMSRKKANAEANRQRAESARVAREKTTAMMQNRRKKRSSSDSGGGDSTSMALGFGVIAASDSGSSYSGSSGGDSGGGDGGGGGCD